MTTIEKTGLMLMIVFLNLSLANLVSNKYPNIEVLWSAIAIVGMTMFLFAGRIEGQGE